MVTLLYADILVSPQVKNGCEQGTFIHCCIDTLQDADIGSFAETIITLILWFLFWFPGFIYALFVL